MKDMKRKKKTFKLWKKLAMAFCLIIISIMCVSVALHIRTMNAMRDTIYEGMEAHAEYYQQTFETELQNILDLQIGFFADRKLPFLAGPQIVLSAYEEREALLSVQERLQSVLGVSDLIESGVLYIPHSGYCVTDSDIRTMTEEDRDEMRRYLQSGGGRLHFDGNRYYAVRTGESRIIFSGNPKFAFVLVFSTEQVRKRLEVCKPSKEGGTFLYNEAEQILIENTSADGTAGEILSRLQQNDDGSYSTMQCVRIRDNNYLVLVGSVGDMGLFIQYVREMDIVEFISQSWVIMALFLAGMIIMAILFVCYVQRLVHRPLEVLMRAFGRVKEGNFEEHIYRDREDEFSYLYRGFNEMEDRLKQLIEEVYVQKNLAQKAQLKQLQAQINPHFLYNSFFILSRRIKRQDLEGAEEFAKHLGNYFKYLARDEADYIPLRQEVDHAASYAAVQGTRFAGRIRVELEELPKETAGIPVPRLILQPLLENAFKYGLENKTEQGLLRMRFVRGGGCMEIIVEDNGDEAADAVLKAMQDSLNDTGGGEVTGIVNIHRRLQIYFGGSAGVTVGRSGLGGAAVTLRIPETPAADFSHREVSETEGDKHESKSADCG